MNKNFRGFTLIELLITITILGILSGIVSLSFINPPKQARDTQRKSDLSQYRTLLEAYANKGNSLYPIYGSAPSVGVKISTGSAFCTTVNGSGSCPEDPKSSIATYKYCSNAAGVNYALWARLEAVTSTTYWTVCSDGKSGTSATVPTCAASFNCNLP